MVTVPSVTHTSFQPQAFAGLRGICCPGRPERSLDSWKGTLLGLSTAAKVSVHIKRKDMKRYAGIVSYQTVGKVVTGVFVDNAFRCAEKQRSLAPQLQLCHLLSLQGPKGLRFERGV